jgi:anti-sigma regulatory factor (Ser/Thr protein kinase)
MSGRGDVSGWSEGLDAPGGEESFSATYPAVAESIPVARARLADFARAAGAPEEVMDAVRLAVSEALTNAVMHAYSGVGGDMHVTAARAAEELWVLISDDGSGLRRRRDTPGLGLGLELIARSCDDFAIVKRSGGGTEVRMRFGVGGAPRTGEQSLTADQCADRSSRPARRRDQPWTPDQLRGSLAWATSLAGNRGHGTLAGRRR